MPKKPELKIAHGETAEVEFLYDKCITGQNNYGDYWMYSFKVLSVKDGNDEDIMDGQLEMIYFANEKTHNQLQDYKSGATVKIKSQRHSNGENSWFQNVVTPTGSTTKSKSSDNNADRNLEIKWGMAFNNATRLIASMTTTGDMFAKVEAVEKIMPDMFKIACSMPEKEITEDGIPF
jgi:hypothetical protein